MCANSSFRPWWFSEKRPLASSPWLQSRLFSAGAAAGANAGSRLSRRRSAALQGRIIQLVALLTVLSLAPGLLMMVTSFTRFVIALSFLRSGLGLQSTPANLVLISLFAVHDLLRHGADFRQVVEGRDQADDGQPAQRGGGLSENRRAVPRSSCWPRRGRRT